MPASEVKLISKRLIYRKDRTRRQAQKTFRKPLLRLEYIQKRSHRKSV